MTSDTETQTAHELLRQARTAYYDKADDKACARFLWQATFNSIQQLAAQMGHPCQDQEQAKEFARYLEREHGGKVRHAYAMLFFGLGMLDHAEDGWYSQEPEFAWTFQEFPMVIRTVTHAVATFTAYADAAKS